MSKVVVTGACGFIGTCLSLRLMDEGIRVIGIDNLSRPGSEVNALELLAGDLFTLYRVDLSNTPKVDKLFSELGSVDVVFHLAAQTAVTTSYVDRQRDFLDNAVASFNVIESVKRYSPDAYCLYASTNKVYGHIQVSRPVGLDYSLNPYTPYGVSKATGELYFTEFGRTELGLRTCSLRQSCIYGHHQYGVEDQGWIAWFAIANILDLPITIYGDGEQIRDLLFIDDLIDLYLACWQRQITGVYPVGGGPLNAINLKQGLDLISSITGKPFTTIRYDKVRSGDQPYFVADLSWIEKVGLDWSPRTDVEQGVRKMVDWIRLNANQIKKVGSLGISVDRLA